MQCLLAVPLLICEESGAFRLARPCLYGGLAELLSRENWTFMIVSHPYPKIVFVVKRSLLSGYEVLGCGSWTLSLDGRKRQISYSVFEC